MTGLLKVCHADVSIIQIFVLQIPTVFASQRYCDDYNVPLLINSKKLSTNISTACVKLILFLFQTDVQVARKSLRSDQAGHAARLRLPAKTRNEVTRTESRTSPSTKDPARRTTTKSIATMKCLMR